MTVGFNFEEYEQQEAFVNWFEGSKYRHLLNEFGHGLCTWDNLDLEEELTYIQTWLRQAHNVSVCVRDYLVRSFTLGYEATVYDVSNYNRVLVTGKEDDNNHWTYDEALAEGLTKALQLIKK